MAGGVGEGAIPLSVGYGEILHQDQGELFATVLPPVMLGSLTAILLSGTLNYMGKRYPKLTGEGRLQPDEADEMDPHQEEITGHMDVTHIAAAGVTAVTLYIVGIMCHRLFGLPAPVAMLFIAVVIKLTPCRRKHIHRHSGRQRRQQVGACQYRDRQPIAAAWA